MKQIEINTREQLMQFLKDAYVHGRPQLQCEFFLKFTDEEGNEYSDLDNILIQGFNVPQLGIQYISDMSMYGLLKPDVAMDSVKFSFLSDVWANKIISIRDSYYSNGLLAFPSEHKTPNAEIVCRVFQPDGKDDLYQIASFTKVRFSTPIPQVSTSSSEFSLWSCEMTYEGYTQIEQ